MLKLQLFVMLLIPVPNARQRSLPVKKNRGFYEKIFKKSTLYVVRTDNYGNYRNSAPCKNCFDIISELKIKRIIFSTENEDFKIIKTQDYKTEHVSNGNRFLNMTDDEKKSRMQKKRQTSLSPTHIKYTK